MNNQTVQRLSAPFVQDDAILDCVDPGQRAELTAVRRVASSQSAGEDSEGGGRRTPRVLIIEDNEDAADSLREALEFGNREVEVAYNGLDAIEKAREFRPDVILCDIGLPGMDGYDVARALRSDESLKRVALIALTGYARPEDVARARAAGFDRHLGKPPNIETLEEMLAGMRRCAQGPETT